MREQPHKGLFIVLEGGEGSGKSTQARLLAEALDERGVRTCITKEPGDTELGADLRTILLDPYRQPISRKAEALLFAADRAEHVEKVIRPALYREEVVICDRYVASTMAHQAYAGGLLAAKVRSFSTFATDGLMPDVTYYLDIPPAIGLERARQVKTTRFENKSYAYHELVRAGFIRQRKESWVVLDAQKSVDDIHTAIFQHARAACISRGWKELE